MSTFVHKKTRMFMERNDWLRPERRRSESRLKTYPSSTDIRNWCDVVEDRRQHILELVVKGIDKCAGKLVPLDVLLEMLMDMAGGAGDSSKIKHCLQQLSEFISQLHLSPEDVKNFKKMVERMDRDCQKNIPLTANKIGEQQKKRDKDGQVAQIPSRLGDDSREEATKKLTKRRADDECEEICVASQRQSKEQAEIENLVKDVLGDRPTIQTKMQGPGKMVTRIKGIQSGFQVVDDPSNPHHITIKPGKRIDQTKSAQITPEDAGMNDQATSDSEPFKIGFVGSNVSPDKLAAMEALCNEQRDKIEALTKERDILKTKLDACLKELDNFKKIQSVANPSLPSSCQQEIEALEAEIKIMRSGNPSPEEEALIIKKEVEILKRYCSKLKEVESENEKLKGELGSRVEIKEENEAELEHGKIETLKDKLNNLEELTNERDTLAEKVHYLEKQLAQYQSLPGDVAELKNKSDMLDNVMQERDNLCKRVKMMKSMEEEMQKLRLKADRVDELERELRNMSKGDRSSGLELKKTQSRAGSLEVELQNVKCERDAMKKRIENMKKDMENQKSKVTEAEMLRLERDRLQIKLNELADLQLQYEDMMGKMKLFDTIKAERDMYKQKYEEVLDMECQCEMLRSQVDEARTIGRERDQLQQQVQDLETCICQQEDEIRGLVLQVDSLSRSKNDSNNRLNTFKEEIVIKDRLLAASQDKVVQSQSLNSRIKELEKLLHNAEHTILQKDCHIKCLENQITCRGGSLKSAKAFNKREMDSIEQMRKELEAAKTENRRLQEIANKMMSISGDDHVKKMLKQSECAVKRVVQELGKQYKEWDHMKIRNPKGKYSSNKEECTCIRTTGGEISSGDDCEKLREELEELQKEKQKLEMTVRQLQSEGRSGKGFKCPSTCHRVERH